MSHRQATATPPGTAAGRDGGSAPARAGLLTGLLTGAGARAAVAARALGVLGAALLLTWAVPAQAHKPSDAYLQLRHAADSGTVTLRMDIALRDLDRDLTLDADGDGALTWGELRARLPAAQALADAGLHLATDDGACRPGPWQTPQLDEHVDGRHLVLRRDWDCGARKPATLQLDYRLFAGTDPDHRGILRATATPDPAHEASGQPSAGASAPVAPTAATEEVHVLRPGAPALRLVLDAGPRPDGSRGFISFLRDGLHHIAAGADHVLFIVTLLMVAVWRREGGRWVPREAARSAWREAFTLITAFTVAHSLTLGLAAAGVLSPPSRWVESLIALSVLLAALDNLRPFLPGPRWATVAVFGLVHGIGFAGPLQDLGLRGGALLLPLAGFNLGVEAGQLMVAALLLPLALALRASDGYRRWFVRPASAMVALLALAWTLERATGLSLLAATAA